MAGKIDGYRSDPAATSTTGAVYKGAAIATLNGKKQLYAADFHNNQIVVFDANYQPVNMAPGKFVDCTMPRHFAPFNIVEHGGLLFVSYAKQDQEGEDDVPGAGNGFIDVYEPDGDFVERLVSRGPLNSPGAWRSWRQASTAARANAYWSVISATDASTCSSSDIGAGTSSLTSPVLWPTRAPAARW